MKVKMLVVAVAVVFGVVPLSYGYDPLFIDQNGNVGIGTTSPLAGLGFPQPGLEISGQRGTLGLTTTGTSGISTIRFKGPTANSEMHLNFSDGTNPSLSLYSYAGAGQMLTLLGNGNVGIGNTAPAYKLDVSGDIRASDRLIVGDFPQLNTNSGEAWLFRAADRPIGTLTVQLGGATAAKTSFEIVDRGWSKVIASISGEAPAASLVVSSYGAVLANLNGGNFGIGVLTPSEKLEVWGTNQTVKITQNPSVAGGANLWLTAAGSSAYYATIRLHNAAIRANSSTSDLHLGAQNAVDALNIQSNTGNVGIGNTAPAEKLDVSGGIRIGNTTTPNEGTIRYNNGNFESCNGRTWRSLQASNITPWDQTFEDNISYWGPVNNTSFTKSTAQAYEGSYSFRIKRNDLTGAGGAYYNLGTSLKPGSTYILSGYYKMVGSSSAQVRLNSNALAAWLDGTTQTNITLANATNWTYFSISIKASPITTGSNFVWLGYYTDLATEAYFDNLVLTEGSFPQIISSFNGNAGIGTMDPKSKLDVVGTIRVSYDATKYLGIYTNSSGDCNIQASSGWIRLQSQLVPAGHIRNDGLLRITTSSGNIRFSPSDVATMEITNGKVGIGTGTTAPQSKLQVNGGIQCGDDIDAPVAAKVGTLRYKVTANASYAEMCMQTGAATYAWVIIKSNTW